MRKKRGSRFASCIALILAGLLPVAAMAYTLPSGSVELADGWQLQYAAKVPQTGAQISSAGFNTVGWYNATVPGTVLTSLVNDGIYPEPLYGENDRASIVPESLAHNSYWYRSTVEVPRTYRHRRVWLHFDGVNYSAVVWVNGTAVGTIRGAFIRGIFDITSLVKPGKKAAVAVEITPQPHPGVAHEHDWRDGVGHSGGDSSLDGPTFLCTMGWDWLPAIHDRDSGIWQPVFLTSSGPVVIKDPLVTTDLPLPKIDSSDVMVQATVENVSDRPVRGVLQGAIGKIIFARVVRLAPRSTQTVRFDAANTPALHIDHPRLWWPNGYGSQYLYHLHLDFKQGRKVSGTRDLDFGVRKITYSVPGSNTLTISVNNVPIFIRGGDWGLDEAMKRIPRARLEAEIRMHQLAHLDLIRNWVGQSTGEDFYELCDKYGILVWDEFFQPNSKNGPDPIDLKTYVANVRDKVLRYRNHPSILLWCGRNEAYPPPQLDSELRKLLAELDPTRLYQPSSTDGGGVRSYGPYYWRVPRDFYKITNDYFKTETGSISIPTLESIHGMMPRKDWETIDDDWAEHDFAKGGAHGDRYRAQIATRYGTIRNLADFVRKAQMANYEAFRAMYEGRNAKLFHPATGVITWMSNPAQPSFVWQIYHYDLEPMASYFAVMHASELVHIQFNQADGHVQVINNLPAAVKNATARISIYNLDGSLVAQHRINLTAQPDLAADLGPVEFPASVSAVHFIKLDLFNAQGKLISTNFYWRALPTHPDDLTALNQLPVVTLVAKAKCRNVGGERIVTVTVHNPSPNIALMAHLQLRRASGERVLPVYYSDNYISLVPNETRTITIEAALSDFKGEDALVVFDGWNVTVAAAKFRGNSVAPNLDAQPDLWPATGLPTEGTTTESRANGGPVHSQAPWLLQ